MLEMRPCCECCNRDLPADSTDARICSFECTYCAECSERDLRGRCPNCGGELVRRPARSGAMSERHPASSNRVVKYGGCDAGNDELADERR